MHQDVRPAETTATADVASDPPLLHWVSRGEFPIALCGYLSTLKSFPENDYSTRGRDICTQCQRLASQRLRDGTGWR